IASGGVRVLNDEVVQALDVPESVIERVVASEQQELERRERIYRGDRPAPDVHGRTVILVDDGLATGSSMRAAVAALRQQKPDRMVLPARIGAPETCAELEREADEAICAAMPRPFYGVGIWYGDFSQTTDDEVRYLLERAAQGPRISQA